MTEVFCQKIDHGIWRLTDDSAFIVWADAQDDRRRMVAVVTSLEAARAVCRLFGMRSFFKK